MSKLWLIEHPYGCPGCICKPVVWHRCRAHGHKGEKCLCPQYRSPSAGLPPVNFPQPSFREITEGNEARFIYWQDKHTYDPFGPEPDDPAGSLWCSCQINVTGCPWHGDGTRHFGRVWLG